MTEFKKGDKVYYISDIDNEEREGIIDRVVGDKVFAWDSGQNWMPKDRLFHKNKNKIVVGSTYLTPTGLKRTVVFADDRGALADDPVESYRKWYNYKMTGGWTLVPPEEWVCMYTRSDGRVMVTETALTTREKAESWALEHKVKVIQFVRIDANYNTSSV